MTREELCSKIDEAIDNFKIRSEKVSVGRYGNGHINDTFLLTCKNERYILQRMNHEIFTDPEALMTNIERVTGFLREKIVARGGDPERETLNLVRTKDDKPFYRDSIGSYWRMYYFIEDATSLDQVRDKEDFYQSAVSFGNFQSLLSEFDASTLTETIVNFHNTPVRYENFEKALAADAVHRAASVADEIAFFKDRKDDMAVCAKALKEGRLPLRVTHNDTKLNNIMIDNATGKGICVIDLDTVMPGLAVFDFGDSIRFGANTAVEDEKDLSKVSLDLELFETYVKGFLEGCKGSLTEAEIDMLPEGAKIMTMECGMRFLTDYLEGDHYFMVHREGHNLDRTRTQIELVRDMERKWDKMKEIVNKYKK